MVKGELAAKVDRTADGNSKILDVVSRGKELGCECFKKVVSIHVFFDD